MKSALYLNHSKALYFLGYWIPDLAPREKVRVPVAIKVLRDESSRVQNNEILDVSLFILVQYFPRHDCQK